MNSEKVSKQDQHWMKVALSLAESSRRLPRPNPAVGAILVKNGQIIGEGVHVHYGQAHGEILALEKARQSGCNTLGSWLYVTLEPCCHTGKTPPCTEAIIAAGVERVIIAAEDPNPLVAGRGIERLKQAGIAVQCGIMSDEAKMVNREFHHWMSRKRPYGILKAALTLDGKVATERGRSQWITGEASRRVGHGLRSQAMAIMIGANTLRQDDPQLSARYEFKNGPQPLRVVLSRRLELPHSAKLWEVSHQKTMVFTALGHEDERVKRLLGLGVGVTSLVQFGLDEVLKQLAIMAIDSVQFEGGAELYKSALALRAVQEAHLFYGAQFMGGQTAKSLFAGEALEGELSQMPRLINTVQERLEDDFYIRGQLHYEGGVF